MEKISIIIPAYNEEKRIKETLNSNLKFFKNLKKRKILDFEIIAVVNGSKDRTIEIVKGFAKKNKELRYLNLKRGAKGYAVKIGKILDFEIIAVVNGSKDRTIEIVKGFAKKNKELRYLNLKRGAKGYAVIEGFKEALKGKSNLIGFKDADMATSPESFYELIKKINNYDGIIASRYIKGSIINTTPTLERIFA